VALYLRSFQPDRHHNGRGLNLTLTDLPSHRDWLRKILEIVRCFYLHPLCFSVTESEFAVTEYWIGKTTVLRINISINGQSCAVLNIAISSRCKIVSLARRFSSVPSGER
jgi:hypothetical protein